MTDGVGVARRGGGAKIGVSLSELRLGVYLARVNWPTVHAAGAGGLQRPDRPRGRPRAGCESVGRLSQPRLSQSRPIKLIVKMPLFTGNR